MFIYILLLVIIYIYIRKNINYLYFQPSPKRNIDDFDNIHSKYKCLNINGHYAIFRKRKGKGKGNRIRNIKGMVIAHGNAGSFLDRGYLIDRLDNYDGDIYLFEYPEFSGLDGKANIDNCVKETLFWINYVKLKYKKIDLFGESIGGGIIIETCYRHSIGFINTIYLQSTFTSMADVIKNLNYGLYIIYNLLLLNDLNTIEHLKYIKCNNYIIIHSLEDSLINYNQAIKNHEILKKMNKNVKFIQGSGTHGNTIFTI